MGVLINSFYILFSFKNYIDLNQLFLYICSRFNKADQYVQFVK